MAVEIDEKTCRRIAVIARSQAKQVIGHLGFQDQDREDIESELVLHTLRKFSRYDPSRSTVTTYVTKVMVNRLRTLIRARKSESRNIRAEFSLDEFIEGADGSQIGRADVMDSDQHLIRVGLRNRTEGDLRDLAIDVERAVGRLSPKHAELCVQLMFMKRVDVTRQSGLPRSTIFGRVRQIRKLLRQQGLECYSDSEPTLFARSSVENK